MSNEMMNIMEELKNKAREAFSEVEQNWEVIQASLFGRPWWFQYATAFNKDTGCYQWEVYIFEEDPEILDARNYENYLNRFDEMEYLGKLWL